LREPLVAARESGEAMRGVLTNDDSLAKRVGRLRDLPVPRKCDHSVDVGVQSARSIDEGLQLLLAREDRGADVRDFVQDALLETRQSVDASGHRPELESQAAPLARRLERELADRGHGRLHLVRRRAGGDGGKTNGHVRTRDLRAIVAGELLTELEDDVLVEEV